MEIKTAFSAKQQDALYHEEDASWWFQYRGRLVCSFVQRYMPHTHVWDVGGGNGYTTAVLQKAGFACTLLEPGERGCSNAKKRGVQSVQCGTLNADTPPESMESICLLDVLEHIEGDQAFLDNAYKALKPGGYLLATVPARQELWSYADIQARHFRRYNMRVLCE